jgi:UDP-glucose 4-epimerase
LAEGATVRVLDDLSTGRRANLDDLGPDVEILEGDLRDPDAVRRATAGCRYVVHHAALGSVPRSIEDPATSHEVNATGTLNVLLAARDARVERVVYASSSSVYGDRAGARKREEDGPAPLSPYALSKYCGEAMCGLFTRLYGLEAVSLRYFNVFGPRQDPNSRYAAVIPRFVTAMLARRAPVVYGDGTQSRDFTFVDNVVEANVLALTAPAARAIDEGGGVYNIACGSSISLMELIGEINRALDAAVEPVFEPGRPGDVKHSQAAIDRARLYLGYDPCVAFQRGIERTIEWFESEGRADGSRAAGVATPRPFDG